MYAGVFVTRKFGLKVLKVNVIQTGFVHCDYCFGYSQQQSGKIITDKNKVEWDKRLF
uniref:Uncharacterized protein n=1 Tax=Anguilla anguilla TaxID=7936 RepID=A0A0E9XWR2_ANGAN